MVKDNHHETYIIDSNPIKSLKIIIVINSNYIKKQFLFNEIKSFFFKSFFGKLKVSLIIGGI